MYGLCANYKAKLGIESFLFAKVELLKAQTMYAKRQTSFDSEKIAQHIDGKDEWSFVFFNLGTAKNCCKICDVPSSDGVLNGDCSKLKENNDKEKKGSLS